MVEIPKNMAACAAFGPGDVRLVELPVPVPDDYEVLVRNEGYLFCNTTDRMIVENLFETRFKYAGELKRMGADILVKGRTALIQGGRKLHGASVTASDLRGGAALVLAGLAAEGQTTVLDLSHIDRGYGEFEQKLRLLQAKIRRVKI